MITMSLTAIIHKEQDIYVAQCPEVGTVSQGYTVEEAIANLKEATELYLEEFPRPDITSTSTLLTVLNVAVHA
jgi:predicted RNase H-like HicB family nuclease